MDNQHRQIKGYRELTQKEIDLMNRIKELGREVEEVALEVEQRNRVLTHDINAQLEPNLTLEDIQQANRWLAIARTQLQQGGMALIRAVAKSKSFF